MSRSTLEVLKQRLAEDLAAEGLERTAADAVPAADDATTPLPRRARGR